MAKLLLVFIVAVLLGLASTCMATVYTVGDSAGWDISADLTSWPTKKKFMVGDVLLFQYSSYHTVKEVGKDGYDSCTLTNAIQSSKGGNTTVPLTSPGKRYFICGVLSHCLGGMRLQVTVEDKRVIPPAGSPLPSQEPEAPATPLAKSGGDPPVTSDGFSTKGRSYLMVCWSFAVVFLSFLGCGI